MVKKKTVYLGMSADLIHPGHINIIKKSSSYGRVCVGLLTDKAIASYKRLPFMDFKKRYEIISSIKGVDEVIPQYSLDYTDNLEKLKPNYVVHGDDWKYGIQSETRKKVIKTLEKWKGKLIEIPYTKGISSTDLIEQAKSLGITAVSRLSALKRLLNSKDLIKINEVHNGISGILTEKTYVNKKNKKIFFDGMFSSSATLSAAMGKPDLIEVDFTKRLSNLNEIFEITSLPLVFAAGNGGSEENFKFTIKSLQRLGVSAVIIDDKVPLNKKSNQPNSKSYKLEGIKNFQNRIKLGKSLKISENFLIISRVSSLIFDKELKKALKRAKAYIEAGSDCIMIDSNKKGNSEIISFCKLYKKLKNKVPLMIIPTIDSTLTEDQWKSYGVNILCYSNQMFNSSVFSMHNTIKSILHRGRYDDTNSYQKIIID